MRITRETLNKVARDTADKYSRRNRSLMCIYLTGSLLSDAPLLGGTTDIDLIFVHNSEPPVSREVVRLTDEVHLDIAHYSQTLFHHPRNLRYSPWVGSFLNSNPIALHDTGHWFEFTQAGAGAQFDMPDNIIQRARQLAEIARQGWFALSSQPLQGTPSQLHQYFKVIENAANAIVLLSSAPLTERRFLLNFSERAEAAGRPGLYTGLLDLIQAEDTQRGIIESWLQNWHADLNTAAESKDVPPPLSAPRFAYYERAAGAMLDDHPQAALWLILRTWTRAVLHLEQPSPGWLEACRQLSLSSEHLEARHTALDDYLDAVEETLDNWAETYGV
jgi:hypothetical protein